MIDKNKLLLDILSIFQKTALPNFTCTEEQIEAMANNVLANIPSKLEDAIKHGARDIRLSQYSQNLPSTVIVDLNIDPRFLKELFLSSIKRISQKLHEFGIDHDCDQDGVFVRVAELKKFCKFESVHPLI